MLMKIRDVCSPKKSLSTDIYFYSKNLPLSSQIQFNTPDAGKRHVGLTRTISIQSVLIVNEWNFQEKNASHQIFLHHVYTYLKCLGKKFPRNWIMKSMIFMAMKEGMSSSRLPSLRCQRVIVSFCHRRFFDDCERTVWLYRLCQILSPEESPYFDISYMKKDSLPAQIYMQAQLGQQAYVFEHRGLSLKTAYP